MGNLSNFVKRLRDIMRNDAGINGDAQRIEQIAWMLFLKVYDAKEEDWLVDEQDYVSIIPENCRWQNWAADDRSGSAMTGDALLGFVNNTLFPTLKGLDMNAETPVKKSIVKTTFEDANNYMKDGVLLRQVINVIDELDLSDYDEIHAFGEIYESILKELQSAGSSGEFYTPRAVTDFMAKMIRPEIGETVADFACGTGGFLASWLRELSPKIKTTEDRLAYDRSVYGIEKKQFPYMLCITNMLLHGIDVPNVFHGNSLLRDVLDYTERDRFDVVLMNPPYGGNEKNEVKNHFPADLASSETADLFMSVIMYRLKKNGRAAVILPDGFLFGTDNAKIAIKKKLLAEFNLHTVIRMPHSVFAPYTSITTNILFFDRTGRTKETWFYRLDMPEDYKNFSKTRPMKPEHFAPAMDWWEDRKEITADGSDKARRYSAEEMAARNYNIDLCGYPHEEEEILSPKELILQYQDKRARLNADIDRILGQITGILGDDGESLPYIAKYGQAESQLAALNAGFPAMLKKSILQEAVQGRLVPQNPDDGSAAALLERIRKEKARLVSEGKIKKGGSGSVIFRRDGSHYERLDDGSERCIDDEVPFEIPEGWEWVRCSAIGTIVRGTGIKRTETAEQGLPCIRYGEIYTSYNISFAQTKSFVPKDLYEKSKHISYGDIVFTLTGENKPDIAKAIAYFGETPVAAGGDLAFWTYHGMNPLYLMYFLNSPYAIERKIQLATGDIIVHISGDKIGSILLPVPPLAEQKRIVAKIEELMRCCEML